MAKNRIEYDLLGKVNVPARAYYGSFTTRALKNFQISNYKFPNSLLHAFVHIKLSAAQVNDKLRVLDKKKAKAIEKACKEILKGKFSNQFLVDVYQAGGGTVYNMNVNEVIANRANQRMGGKLGTYDHVHPNNHVNLGQSSNDVMPTVIRLVCLLESKKLLKNLIQIEKSLRELARKHKNTIKSGRTHLQDALPITFGQVFETQALAVKKSNERILERLAKLNYLGMGGTAVGTGSNASAKFHPWMVKQLGKNLKLKLKPSKNLFYHQHSSVELLAFMNSLGECAVEINKFCNDVRLMASGPRTGFAEIVLPEVEPGSSIMPGKINPSMVECVQMCLWQVISLTQAVETASLHAELELQAFYPLITFDCLRGIELMEKAVQLLDEKCVRGIKVKKEKCMEYFENSLANVTFLAPVIGYEKTAELAKKAVQENKSIKEIVLENNVLTEKQWNQLMNPAQLTKPNLEFLEKFKK